MKLVMIIAVGILLLFLLFISGWILAGYLLTGKAFQGRYEGPPEGMSAWPAVQKAHPGISRSPMTFEGPDGITLRGFRYNAAGIRPKALLVLFHGYGMCLEDYLPESAYFCSRGYLVLAFDGSGTGYSDGILRGLPQHLLDLKTVLTEIAKDPELSAYPLLLYGHSWGGYACDTVPALGDWPIRGIVSASGFATAEAALHDHVKRHYGVFLKFAMLGVQLFEHRRFGKIAELGGIDGLAKVECPVLIAQSEDDPIIAFRDNYGVLQKRFQDDPRKTFLPLVGCGHNITIPREIDRRKRRLMMELKEKPDADKLREFCLLQNEVSEELLETFGDFLDRCLDGRPAINP